MGVIIEITFRDDLFVIIRDVKSSCINVNVEVIGTFFRNFNVVVDGVIVMDNGSYYVIIRLEVLVQLYLNLCGTLSNFWVSTEVGSRRDSMVTTFMVVSMSLIYD